MTTNSKIISEGKHPEIATELSRNLNLLHITMMGVGMMIGAGVLLN
jgi:amino acid permease